MPILLVTATVGWNTPRIIPRPPPGASFRSHQPQRRRASCPRRRASAARQVSRRAETLGADVRAPDEEVQVYDGAFGPDACAVLHALASVHALRADGATSLFVRPPRNVTALTPLESALDSALAALNDTTGRTVEYWSREEHMNIDAHVDVDEELLEAGGALSCPAMAHVLYLQVRRGLRGPTVVFPGKRTGWGVPEADSRGLQPESEVGVDMDVIPAVPGRLVRFPGSAMHAVPCPADRWLWPPEKEILLRQEEDREEDDEEGYVEEGEDDEDDENDEEDDYEVERSVLLFNTWPDAAPPPRGVEMGYATFLAGEVEEGYTLEDERRIVEEWTKDYGIDARWLRCNPASEWKRHPSRGNDDPPDAAAGRRGATPTDGTRARVPLMGTRRRRRHDEAAARLRVPEARALRAALAQEERVTRLHLTEEPARRESTG